MNADELEPLVARFVHEMDARKDRHGCISIDEIAGDVIPGLGVGAGEAVLLLHRVEVEGIVWHMQRPNPANRDCPLHVVGLNRDHPFVKAVVANEPLPTLERTPKRRKPIDFRPIKIDGPPLSEQIIRDRR